MTDGTKSHLPAAGLRVREDCVGQKARRTQKSRQRSYSPPLRSLSLSSIQWGTSASFSLEGVPLEVDVRPIST